MTQAPGGTGPGGGNFLSEGFRELGRKLARGKLRRAIRQHDADRLVALAALGRAAWDGKIDLAAHASVRDRLAGLDARAGELSQATSRLEAEGTGASAGPEGHVSAAGEARSAARSAPPPASGESDRDDADETTEPVLTRTAADSQAQAESASRFQRAAQTYGSAGVGAGSILGNEVRLVA